MIDSTSLTFALLRRELCADTDISLPAVPDESILRQAFRLAARHDLAHIVGAALCKTGLVSGSPLAVQCKRQQILAVYRYERIAYALRQMCAVLEEAGIPHMLLKGAHLRRYYPTPEMRTSSDIDLLVKPDDLDRAIGRLTEALNYTRIRRGAHDELLRTQSGIDVELHFSLIETTDERSRRVSQILSTSWETAIPLEGAQFGCTMSVEMLYFYQIAHMAKHFTEGGCGIRFFMDVWVLEHRAPAPNHTRLDAMLAQGDILSFAAAAHRLAEVWFSEAEPDALTLDMANFVISGGVYGSIDNRVQLQRLKRGRFGYFLSRVFLPCRSMKYQYPVLQKHPWLLPFCEVHRWGRLLSKSTARRIQYELNVNQSVTPQSQTAVRDLLNRLGL